MAFDTKLYHRRTNPPRNEYQTEKAALVRRLILRLAKRMLVTTTFDIEGCKITEYKGMVRGITVRSPTLTQGLLGGLKSIIGGRIGAYVNMCEDARQHAYDAMIKHAEELGANAIVGVRYESADVGAEDCSATEVLCYGTAVVIEQK